MSAQINHSVSLGPASSFTMADIREIAANEGIPDRAKLNINHYSGDMRELPSTTIRIEWTDYKPSNRSAVTGRFNGSTSTSSADDYIGPYGVGVRPFE